MLLLLVMDAAAGAMDAAAGGLSLRLERSLSERVPQALEEGTEILLRFGSSEIEQRIQLTRERIARLERTNRQLAAAIGSGDELAAALRALEELQAQVQGGVHKVMQASAPADAAPRAPAAPGSQAAAKVETPGAPEVTAQAEVSAASTVTAPARATAAPDVATGSQAGEPPGGAIASEEAPARQSAGPDTQAPAARSRIRPPAPSDASRFEIPMAGLPQWVVVGALGILVLVVLGWIAMRYLARRAGVQERAMPATHTDNPRDESPVGAPSPGAPSADRAGSASTMDLEIEDDSGRSGTPAEPEPAGRRRTVESDETWTSAMISRKASDPQALREVDTLIAFEQYEKAKALLDEMMFAEPDNPELVLRHYHVRTQGGIDTTDDDEALLKAMMDGPLSDTMKRVRNLGRGLMPGDPLFDDSAKRAAASQVLKESKRDDAGTANADEQSDDTVVQFARTMKLSRSPMAGN